MISAKREPEIISFTQVPKQNQPWRSFKSVRRIKREIKRSIRSGEINHVEVEEDMTLPTAGLALVANHASANSGDTLDDMRSRSTFLAFAS